MNAFVVFAAVVAAASANPQVLLNNGLIGYGLQGQAIGYGIHGQAIQYSGIPAVSQQIISPLATKTQYHAQDELGQASYGYAYPGQAAAAVRDAAGNVRGSYAYINPNGKEVRVAYTAGHGGVQVASNDLPLGPVVNPNVQVVSNLVGPVDTPEVVQAKAAHAIAHQQALARSGRKKRQILTSAVIPSALTYNNALGYSSVINHQGLGYSNVINHQGLGYSNVISHQGLGLNAVAYSSPLLNNNVVLGQNLVQGYSTPVVSNVVSQPLREATLTKVVNNPGHAVSYRVD